MYNVCTCIYIPYHRMHESCGPEPLRYLDRLDKLKREQGVLPVSSESALSSGTCCWMTCDGDNETSPSTVSMDDSANGTVASSRGLAVSSPLSADSATDGSTLARNNCTNGLVTMVASFCRFSSYKWLWHLTCICSGHVRKTFIMWPMAHVIFFL